MTFRHNCEIVVFHGVEYPANFRFRKDYEDMPYKEIPELAIVGVALANLEHENNDILVKTNGCISRMTKKRYKNETKK